jgi:thioredoxin
MNIFKLMSIISFFVTLFLTACLGNSSEQTEQTVAKTSTDKAVVISEKEFKTLVMNYEENPEEWLFKGELPAIVDFYADWCAPCRIIAPILDELAKEYKGRVNIYKVNVDNSRNVAAYFGVQNIPTLLFCRMNGLPALQPGGMSKEQFVNAIENFLLKEDK